jgi:ribosome-associated protein
MEIKLEGAEYIELKNLLKVAGLVETGGEAKAVITDGLVKVNGQVETRKANKIKPGMIVTYDGETVTVTA